MELLCQFASAESQASGDLVYHISVCKTSVSQHGCTPRPPFLQGCRYLQLHWKQTRDAPTDVCLHVGIEFIVFNFFSKSIELPARPLY